MKKDLYTREEFFAMMDERNRIIEEKTGIKVVVEDAKGGFAGSGH